MLPSFTYASAAATKVKVFPDPTEVAVEVMIDVAVLDGGGVFDGVAVFVGVAVEVGVSPNVGVAVAVKVDVAMGVLVTVLVDVLVAVFVGVCEGVAGTVAVKVGVIVAGNWYVIHSCGRWPVLAASLLAKRTSDALAPVARNSRPWLLKVPFAQPWVTAVTLISRY